MAHPLLGLAQTVLLDDRSVASTDVPGAIPACPGASGSSLDAATDAVAAFCHVALGDDGSEMPHGTWGWCRRHAAEVPRVDRPSQSIRSRAC